MRTFSYQASDTMMQLLVEESVSSNHELAVCSSQESFESALQKRSIALLPLQIGILLSLKYFYFNLKKTEKELDINCYSVDPL